MGDGQPAEQQSADIYKETQGGLTEYPISRIDDKLERRRVGDMTVEKFGGLSFQEYREAIEFSKLITQARNGIPRYLRNNAGDCLVITTQALRWKLEPVWCMQHSYIAKEESLIAYDAAVHAAIVLSSGLIRGRPRYTYEGEGDERTCTVSVLLRGEDDPFTYTSPPLKLCRPKRNERGEVKGSPLWDRDADHQLAYFCIRNWGRRHMPEILGGVYDRDEFDETTQEETDVIPPAPNLLSRLPGKMAGTGFDPNVVDNGLAQAAAEVQEAKSAGKKARAEPEKAEDKPEAPPPTQAQPTTPPRPQPRPADPSRPAPTHAAPTRAAPNHTTQAQAAEPGDEGSYMAYCARWIEQGADADDLGARWDGDEDLRVRLKVGPGVRKRLEGMLRSRIAELREPKKRK